MNDLNGLNRKREDSIATAIGELVDAGELAGAATLVWRGGKVIQQASVGWRDIAAGAPIERNMFLPLLQR